MKIDHLYEHFLKEIKIRIPEKTKRTSILVDILAIEKEAVYRRLRGEVPFTFREIALISHKLNISIDGIAGITSEKSRPFHLKLTEFTESFEKDYQMMEEYIDVLVSAKESTSEIVEASNTLPQTIILKYDMLSKFYFFKWDYHYNQSHRKFEDFYLTKRLKTLQKRTVIESKKCNSTTYIFDPYIIQYLINDVIHFRNLQLISEHNIKQIKDELYQILHYIDLIAQKGVFTETNKELNIYISGINFDTSYSYIETPKHHVSMVRAFIITNIASTDSKTLEKTKKWIQSLKRNSTLISITAEKERISFLESQRHIIDKL